MRASAWWRGMARGTTIVRARTLRRVLTKPEVVLWAVLRTRPSGLKVRRQNPVGPFAVVFYCAAAGLAIEVDGMAHDMGDNPRRDEARDRWLRGQGISMLRLIVERCATPLHHPADGPPPHAPHGED